MKSVKLSFIIGIILTIIVYLISAFIKMDLNPANWSEDDRSCAVIIWVFFQIIQMVGVCIYAAGNVKTISKYE